MQSDYPLEPLRIGLLGTGFVANFHLQALRNVRHVEVGGVYSPNPERRARFAAAIDAAGLGPCKALDSVEDLVGSEEIDAVWILGPNDTRPDHLRDRGGVCHSAQAIARRGVREATGADARRGA